MPLCVFITGQQIVRRLRGRLFSSILCQEVGFFDKTSTGELINRLSSDAVILGNSVTENLSDGLRAVGQASAGIGMMVREGGDRPKEHILFDFFKYIYILLNSISQFLEYTQ